MILSEVVQLGDKIDIKMKKHTEGKLSEVSFQSSVCDFLSDWEIEIGMPSYEGRMVLFQIGAECDFIFYTKRGMYQCRGMVKNRFRREHLYLLTVWIKSEPVKFQRREFFRIEYVLDFTYYKVDEAFSKLPTTERLYEEIQSYDKDACCKQGVIQDISGGGARFTSKELLEQGGYLFSVMRLTNEKMDETFHLVCKVISSEKHSSLSQTYSNRVKFLYKDLKDREKIVRFIFEEERRLRKKEIGE